MQNKGHYGVQGHSRSSRLVPFESPCATSWHPISYRFGVIAAYCLNFGHLAFSSNPLEA